MGGRPKINWAFVFFLVLSQDISFSRPVCDLFAKIGVQKLNEISDLTVRKRILMTLGEHAAVVDRTFAKEALPVVYCIFEVGH